MIVSPWLSDKLGAEAVCVPTNGFVKNNGDAVYDTSGGMAILWAQRGDVLQVLGAAIANSGGHVTTLYGSRDGRWALTFPVVDAFVTIPVAGSMAAVADAITEKLQYTFAQEAMKKLGPAWEARTYRPAMKFPGWMGKADHEVVLRSARELVTKVTRMNLDDVVIVAHRKAYGSNWETDIAPMLQPVLDDRFTLLV